MRIYMYLGIAWCCRAHGRAICACAPKLCCVVLIQAEDLLSLSPEHGPEVSMTTGGIRYQVERFWVIIVFNFPPRIFRFTGRTTPRSKQEMIPHGVNFVDF